MLSITEQARASARYEVECIRHIHDDGAACPQRGQCPKSHTEAVRWRDGFWNTVVTAGLNRLLNASFDTVASSVAWFVGLKGAGDVDAADTLASHGGWSEITSYTGDRQPWTKNAAASAGAMSNSSSKAEFPITGSAAVAGIFLTDAETGTSGILYGAGNFATSRDVENEDTLRVTVTLAVTAGA